MKRLLIAPALLALLTGCGSVDITPISADQVHDPKVVGARFYRPWPYLLVTVTQVDPNLATKPGPGGDAPPDPAKPNADASKTAPTSTMQIVWLPKMNEPYLINVKSGYGVVNGSFTLDSGWNLTSVGSQIDSKIPETITAVSGLLTAAVGAGAAGVHPGAPGNPLLLPGLYRIDFDDKGFVSGMTLVK